MNLYDLIDFRILGISSQNNDLGGGQGIENSLN